MNFTRIAATNIGGNDFGITRVAIEVDTVDLVIPKPGTTTLLGFGFGALVLTVFLRRTTD